MECVKVPFPPVETADPEYARFVNSFVRSGDLTMEESMRILFPDEAQQIYNPSRWPWGDPEKQS